MLLYLKILEYDYRDHARKGSECEVELWGFKRAKTSSFLWLIHVEVVPLAWGGSSTARVLLRLCPESACQTGLFLELSSRLEAGGCAVPASLGVWAP